MSLTPSELIQILQLIILSVTAAVFVCQFVLRLFQNRDTDSIIQAVGEEKALNKLQNGTNSFFVSIFFFAISGSVISLYLVLYTVPGEVNHFLNTFYEYRYYSGSAVVLAIIAIAAGIQGDLENRHTGITGLAVSTIFAGLVSVFLLLLYFVLLAANRSIEWIFFISGISLAIALTCLLFGFFFIVESITDILNDV